MRQVLIAVVLFLIFSALLIGGLGRLLVVVTGGNIGVVELALVAVVAMAVAAWAAVEVSRRL